MWVLYSLERTMLIRAWRRVKVELRLRMNGWYESDLHVILIPRWQEQPKEGKINFGSWFQRFPSSWESRAEFIVESHGWSSSHHGGSSSQSKSWGSHHNLGQTTTQNGPPRLWMSTWCVTAPKDPCRNGFTAEEQAFRTRACRELSNSSHNWSWSLSSSTTKSSQVPPWWLCI